MKHPGTFSIPERNTVEEHTAEVPAESKSIEVVAIPVVAAEPPPLPIADDIVVIAKTREEMERAQSYLVSWVDPKIAGLERDLAEAQTNLDLAVKRKWGTAAFRKSVALLSGRVAYYQRIRAALLAGYVIMPDMPGTTIAVRTAKLRPPQKPIRSKYYGTVLPSATSDGSAVGEGRYIDPAVKYKTWDETGKDSSGRDTTTHLAQALDFDTEFEFPVKFVKPQILDDTSRAMMHKIFDEIGVIGVGSPKPGKKLRATTLHGDPIVLGRVVRYEGTKRFSCAFLVTWWLDTKTI